MQKENEQFIFDVDETNFTEKVLDASHQKTVLVDFWAEWCMPCVMLTPLLEQLTREYAGVWLLAKVEADENMKLAGHYKLRGFPTVLLFQNGELKGHFSGAKPAHWIKTFLHEHGVYS